jgi:hypothetical protein
MGRRSGIIDDEEGLARLSPAELDQEIVRGERRLRLAPNERLKKAFQARIHWLERFRERRQQ